MKKNIRNQTETDTTTVYLKINQTNRITNTDKKVRMKCSENEEKFEKKEHLRVRNLE